jgi:hypothetical protein
MVCWSPTNSGPPESPKQEPSPLPLMRLTPVVLTNMSKRGGQLLPAGVKPAVAGALKTKDIALSRRKPGLESRWGHNLACCISGLFLRQKEHRKPCSHRRAHECLGQGVRLEGNPRPEYER